jgi:hypothetical protein
MRVVTWTSTNAPTGNEACARILLPAMSPKARKKGKEEYHPVVFFAATAAEAESKARHWWAAEQARAEARRVQAEKAAERIRARKAA